MIRTPEYQRNHRRVRDIRGRAADQRCASCPHQAADWSFQHKLDLADVTDPYCYKPLCRICHAAYDWSPNRREAQSERMRSVTTSLTSDQLSERGRPGAAAQPRAAKARGGRSGMATRIRRGDDFTAASRMGTCQRWNINRGKPCICGEHL